MNAIRPYFYIGSLRETQDLSLLQSVGIGAILQIASQVPHPGIETRYLPIDDGVPLNKATLQTGVGFLREQKARGRVVMVACALGVSRSVTFGIAFLKEEEGLSLLEAYRQIVRVRPDARPHPVLWQSLCDAYGEPVPLIEMVKVSRAALTNG